MEHQHFALDSDNDSVIHQDSDDDDDDVEQDDDVDIGFRRHQYQTFDDDDRPNRRRRRTKEDSIYGVFMENDDGNDRIRKRSKTTGDGGTAPMFVAAQKTEIPPPKTKESPQIQTVDPVSTNKQKGNDEKEETEESLEDIEIQEKQKAADDHFLSLLSKGKGKPQQRRREPAETPPPTQHEENLSMGLRMGMPTSFGRMVEQKLPEQPVTIDPNVAKWEKHTKGIGSKLLAKMGWKGTGGLGSNRRKVKPAVSAEENNEQQHQQQQQQQQQPLKKDAEKVKKGISKPIDVVVRPANLGLGFGNFREASMLKSNRQLEAEVRGIEPPDAKKKKQQHDGESDEYNETWGPVADSSAIPTTKDLLSQKPWKRYRKKSQQVVKAQVIPYAELIEKQKADGQPVIIDMRGPNADSSSTRDDGKVPLAEELLHNVSFLLNTHENQLHSCSHFVKSSERKCKSLKSDIEEMEKRREEGKERLAKVNKTIAIVSKVEALAGQGHGNGNGEHLQDEIRGLVQQLGETFTAEERQNLKFWEILAPTLLSPLIQMQLDEWDPLKSLTSSKSIIDSVFELDLGCGISNQDKNAIRSLRESIILHQLLPKIKQVLESSRWNPCHGSEEALNLYEYLLHKASRMAAPRNENDRHDEEDNGQVFPWGSDYEVKQNGSLMEAIKKDIIIDTIHPKIQNTLSNWKPALKNGNSKSLQLQERLDLWILPWVLHMDYPAILPNLLSDCKRKLKSSISLLQRKSSNDSDFLRACIDTLKPWQRVYDSNTMQRLVSDYVTPYLARCLSKQKIRRDSSEQDWGSLRTAFELHGRGFLSDTEFISLLEGELLTNWAITIHGLLLRGETAASIAENYRGWKIQMFVKPDLGEHDAMSLDHSLRLLREDRQICSIFYSVLRMVQITTSPMNDQLDEMQPPRTNFRVVSTRRAKEKQLEVQEDYVRMESKSSSEMEARLRLQRRNAQTPTFREVVEEYAKEHGIVFQPRMGVNSLKDGKQVFLFGKAPIYMVGNVIYACRNTEWKPISLDQLVESAANSF